MDNGESVKVPGRTYISGYARTQQFMLMIVPRTEQSSIIVPSGY